MNKLHKVAAYISVVALVAMPLLAAAQVTTIPRSSPITGIGSFENFLRTILNWIFIFVGILAVIAILISAIYYITAGGDEERRKTAGSWLKYGIIGIVVAIIAGSIIPIIDNFLSGN